MFKESESVMTEQINCPLSGTFIERNAIKCKNCDALFKEPELPNIKFKELAPFLVIDILTIGFFSTIWFFINGKAINSLVENDNKKDMIKLNWLFLLLTVNGGFYLFFFFKHAAFLILFSILQCIIYVALTYRVLRIIQKYTSLLYNVDIAFNPCYLVFFNIIYLIHFIETYQNRVFHTHEYFDWKSPQAIFLIILLVLIIFFLRFYNEMFLLLN